MISDLFVLIGLAFFIKIFLMAQKGWLLEPMEILLKVKRTGSMAAWG